jgi:hypothetical protein
MAGSVKLENISPGRPEPKERPYLKKNQREKSWRYG